MLEGMNDIINASLIILDDQINQVDVGVNLSQNE
jgi:hypothetical protein